MNSDGSHAVRNIDRLTPANQLAIATQPVLPENEQEADEQTDGRGRLLHRVLLFLVPARSHYSTDNTGLIAWRRAAASRFAVLPLLAGQSHMARECAVALGVDRSDLAVAVNAARSEIGLEFVAGPSRAMSSEGSARARRSIVRVVRGEWLTNYH